MVLPEGYYKIGLTHMLHPNQRFATASKVTEFVISVTRVVTELLETKLETGLNCPMEI